MTTSVWHEAHAYLQRLFFPRRYDTRAMLEQYIAAQWGPYLAVPPAHSSEPFYQALIASAARYLPRGGAALDIGCATGRLVFEYERLGAAHAMGVDESARMISFCERIKAGTAAQIIGQFPREISEFVAGDIMQLPLDRTFEFISCINVLDRVAHPRALMDKIAALLRSGGIALIVDPYDWERSSAPESERVGDVRELLDGGAWDELEEATLPYEVPEGEGAQTYTCHLVVLKKR